LARVVADIPAEFQWQLKIPEPPPWTLFDFVALPAFGLLEGNK